MSTQRYQPEPIQPRQTTGPDTTTPTEPRRSPTDRAPATFARANTDRLQNLIDEWNAAFAGTDGE